MYILSRFLSIPMSRITLCFALLLPLGLASCTRSDRPVNGKYGSFVHTYTIDPLDTYTPELLAIMKENHRRDRLSKLPRWYWIELAPPIRSSFREWFDIDGWQLPDSWKILLKWYVPDLGSIHDFAIPKGATDER